jgi:hypothetical protein
MAILCMLIQLVAIGSGIYIAITDSFFRGVFLVAAVLLLHRLLTVCSNSLMFCHQKLFMSDRELQLLASRELMGIGDETKPTAWNVIATVCGLAFIILGPVVIYLFLEERWP